MSRDPGKYSKSSPRKVSHHPVNGGDLIDATYQHADLPAWVNRLGRSSQIDQPLSPKSDEKKTRCQQNRLNGPLEKSEAASQLLKISEAAWRLNVSVKTMRRLIETGKLPVLRIGSSIRIHPQTIENIMRQNE